MKHAYCFVCVSEREREDEGIGRVGLTRLSPVGQDLYRGEVEDCAK
jgi:hypothetical protein